jgi:hypothetical protein
MNKDAYSCDSSFWGPTYQCLMDCEDGFSQWKDLHSPYDFDSIMHYYGNTCSDGSVPLMTHKGSSVPQKKFDNSIFVVSNFIFRDHNKY